MDEKYCKYCGKPLLDKKKGWSIEIKKDGKNVFSAGCDGSCGTNESVENDNNTPKKIIKG